MTPQLMPMIAIKKAPNRGLLKDLAGAQPAMPTASSRILAAQSLGSVTKPRLMLPDPEAPVRRTT